LSFWALALATTLLSQLQILAPSMNFPYLYEKAGTVAVSPIFDHLAWKSTNQLILYSGKRSRWFWLFCAFSYGRLGDRETDETDGWAAAYINTASHQRSVRQIPVSLGSVLVSLM